MCFTMKVQGLVLSVLPSCKQLQNPHNPNPKPNLNPNPKPNSYPNPILNPNPNAYMKVEPYFHGFT